MKKGGDGFTKNCFKDPNNDPNVCLYLLVDPPKTALHVDIGFKGSKYQNYTHGKIDTVDNSRSFLEMSSTTMARHQLSSREHESSMRQVFHSHLRQLLGDIILSRTPQVRVISWYLTSLYLELILSGLNQRSVMMINRLHLKSILSGRTSEDVTCDPSA